MTIHELIVRLEQLERTQPQGADVCVIDAWDVAHDIRDIQTEPDGNVSIIAIEREHIIVP